MSLNNKSPLRYPGGKTRACKKLNEILLEYFNTNNFENIISPFFGGGSFEFYIQNKYNLNIIANDKFEPLYNFWIICKNEKKTLCDKLYVDISNITKEKFKQFRTQIINELNILNSAYYYFIINRCSF